MPSQVLSSADIRRALGQLAPGKRQDIVFDAPQSARHEHDFLVLIKPEVIQASGAELAVDLILRRLAEADVKVQRACAMSGDWARASGCIAACYLPLYTYARGEFDPRAGARLSEHARANGLTVDNILSASAFLTRYKAWTPEALATVCECAGVRKLGAGLYVSHWTALDGAPQVVVNGFQPQHEAHLSGPGAVLVALHCRTAISTAVLREQVIGGIAPASAHPDSIRNRLWRAREAMGLAPTIMYNCVHVSPGILEAAFHIGPFFMDPPAATLSRNEVAALVSSETLRGALLAPHTIHAAGLLIDAFDHLEGLDAAESRIWLQAYS